MDDVCGSKFWDWNSTWYSENPDFTPCFKNTVLVWIPCVFLWIFSPLQIYFQQKSEYRDISFSSFNIIKLILIVTAAFLQFIDAVHKYAVGDLVPIVYFYTPIINCITFALFFILTFGNLKMGIRWSGILFTFSLIAVICGIPNLCTAVSKWSLTSLYSEDTMKQLAYILYYTAEVMILILNFFTDGKPPRSLCLTTKFYYPDNQDSFLSNVFLFWFDPFIWASYGKPLKNYLWDVRPDHSATEIESIRANSAKLPVSIMKELFKKYGSRFWYCFFVKTVYEVATLLIFVVFYFLIQLFEEKKQIWKGYLYCVLLFVALILPICSYSLYQKAYSRFDMQVKGAVLSTLYSKALRISNGARQEYTTSDIVNLLSVDTNHVQNGILEFQHLVSLLVQAAASFVYLWFILGPSIIVGIIVFIAVLWASYLISAYMKKLQLEEMKNKDIRGKFMQEIFAGIKVLKMYAWELSFKKVATELRYGENKTLKKIGSVNTVFQVIFGNAPFLLSLCAFAAYTFLDVHNVLDIMTMFVSLAIFNSFRITFQSIPLALLSIQQLLISFQRIDKFLNVEELDEDAVSHEPTAESLIMEGATFFWNNADGRPILENLNLKINKGSLVAIVGPVGAGKSSLIAAFLGEMYKISGYVNTNGTLAYVPQQAWILNTTVKQNIIVDEDVDLDLYNKAINACALQQDLEELPAGDTTEIGGKGINLSGGQKQRVSLARAVCSDAEIYFFDDPLSAVDSQVADHIFSKVLGPDGILNKKTRVLITHSTEFLSFMDQIIVLVNGRIVENGTYDELLDKGGEFSQLTSSISDKTNDEIENDREECDETDENFINEKDVHENTISRKLNTPSPKNSLRRRKQKIETKPPPKKLIEEEHIKTKQVSTQLYWTYISETSVLLTTAIILFYTIYQAVNILSNAWLSSWVSTNTSSDNRYSFLLVYAAFGVGQSLASVVANSALFLGAIKASTYFYDKLLGNVLRWPMSSFDSTPIGRIISRFGDDVYALDNVIGYKIALSIVLIIRYVSILVLVAFIIPSSIVVIIPAVVVYVFIKKFFDSLFHQLKRIESIHKSPLYSHAVESVSGAQSLRAYGFQKKFISKFQEKCDRCSAAYYSTTVCLRWLDCRCVLLGMILICSLAILCILEINTLPITHLCLIMLYVTQLSRGLDFTLLNISQVDDNILSVERITEYMEYPQEPSWEKSLQNVSKNWPTNGEVIFHRYHLRYRKDLDLVLKGLTFKIESGEKVGIIGRTGAGKTSIILALFRIVEPADGTILIDNVDITTIGLHKLRSKLTVIPQDPVLFSGTLRFNLDPFEDHEDERLWNALEKSHLKKFVQNLPGGLRYNIEEGGRNMSFGQRQLICLARALLRKSKILILDEATASVDVKTDELIQKTIRTEFFDCTVITIAHRLNTLQDYDKILILDGGHMVDFDTMENLLKSENSRLREIMKKVEHEK